MITLLWTITWIVYQDLDQAVKFALICPAHSFTRTPQSFSEPTFIGVSLPDSEPTNDKQKGASSSMWRLIFRPDVNLFRGNVSSLIVSFQDVSTKLMALQEQAKAFEEEKQQEREQSFKVRKYWEIMRKLRRSMLSKSGVVSWAVCMVSSIAWRNQVNVDSYNWAFISLPYLPPPNT